MDDREMYKLHVHRDLLDLYTAHKCTVSMWNYSLEKRFISGKEQAMRDSWECYS